MFDLFTETAVDPYSAGTFPPCTRVFNVLQSRSGSANVHAARPRTRLAAMGCRPGTSHKAHIDHPQNDGRPIKQAIVLRIHSVYPGTRIHISTFDSEAQGGRAHLFAAFLSLL